MSFGAFLKQVIDEHGFSEAALAAKLGVQRSYISGIESGREKPPTIKRCEQIADLLDLSKKETDQLISLAHLERAKKENVSIIMKGLNHKNSIIQLSENEADYGRIPLLGRCPASPKTWQADEVDGWHFFPKAVLKGRRMYLLKAKGDSMNKAGIDDGDLVIVDADQQPTNGKIVIICVDGEFTIKRFYRNEDQVTLMPDSTNASHVPMSFNARKCEILLRGVVEAVHMKKLK